MSIIKLDKKEFTIYYNIDLKYAVCAVEQFIDGLHDIGIRRKLIGEPFKLDPDLPAKYSLTIEDYENYIAEGGSYGHLCQASLHKGNLEAYHETFYLTNICPQESICNGGLWSILEHYTR